MKKIIIYSICIIIIIYAGVNVTKDDLVDKYNKNRYYSIVSIDGLNFGIIDSLGNWLLEPKYKSITSFNNDIVTVYIENKWGYVNYKGEWVFEPFDKIKQALPFTGNGIATIVNSDGKYKLIDKKGNELFPFQDTYSIESRFSNNGFAVIKTDTELYGYINANGKIIIQPQFSYAEPFSNNGLALIINSKNGEYEFINEFGETVINNEFQKAKSFSDYGLAAAMDKSGLWGYIDDNGKWLIEAKFEEANEFSNIGIACVKNKDKYIFINDLGEKVIDQDFYFVSKFDKGD